MKWSVKPASSVRQVHTLSKPPPMASKIAYIILSQYVIEHAQTKAFLRLENPMPGIAAVMHQR